MITLRGKLELRPAVALAVCPPNVIQLAPMAQLATSSNSNSSTEELLPPENLLLHPQMDVVAASEPQVETKREEWVWTGEWAFGAHFLRTQVSGLRTPSPF